MYTVLLVIHTIVVLFLIGIVLIQRSDQDGMGLGGGSQFMTGRASANLLTRTTSILATIFIISSLVLAVIGGHSGKSSVLDSVADEPAAAAPAATDKPAEAGKPAAPAVPKPE